MSYTEMKYIDESGDVIGYKEFHNSHYHGSVIWETLAVRYGLCNEDTYHKLLCDNKQPIWDLQCSLKISMDDWYVLLSTFDNIVIPINLIYRVAIAFENFKVIHNDWIDHGKFYAETMREILSLKCRGICFYQTSICKDPWIYRIICPHCGMETDEHEPYNIDKGNKHFILCFYHEFIEKWGKNAL